MEEGFISYLREGCMAHRYLNIAVKNLFQAERALEKVQIFLSDYESEKNDKSNEDRCDIFQFIEDNIDQCNISVIVFAALAAESFINDYICRIVGDDLFYREKQSLSVIEKVKYCYEIKTKKKLDTGNSRCYSLLKKLVRERNKLVHNKSRGISNDLERYFAVDNTAEYEQSSEENVYDMYMDFVKAHFKSSRTEFRTAFQSLQAIFELTKFIDEIDCTAYAEIFLFGSDAPVAGCFEDLAKLRKFFHASEQPPILHKSKKY